MKKDQYEILSSYFMNDDDMKEAQDIIDTEDRERLIKHLNLLAQDFDDEASKWLSYLHAEPTETSKNKVRDNRRAANKIRYVIHRLTHNKRVRLCMMY